MFLTKANTISSLKRIGFQPTLMPGGTREKQTPEKHL